MTMTTETNEVFWLPDGCPSWCAFVGTHKASDRPGDRSHMGEAVFVDVTLEPVTGSDPELVEFYLYQLVTDAKPSVHFYAVDRRVALTIGEARQLAAGLNALCDEVDAP